jgi:hypothetical protein
VTRRVTKKITLNVAKTIFVKITKLTRNLFRGNKFGLLLNISKNYPTENIAQYPGEKSSNLVTLVASFVLRKNIAFLFRWHTYVRQPEIRSESIV